MIPINARHSILKIPWTKSALQIGRGPYVPSGNDVELKEKRISNIHCRIVLAPARTELQVEAIQWWRDSELEPEVWLEDLNSSNGCFVRPALLRVHHAQCSSQVNGIRVKGRRMLLHGDEVSLGHASTMDNHDVRYIFRSVGGKGQRMGRSTNQLIEVGEIYERYQLLDR